jgi:hypothetical protein
MIELRMAGRPFWFAVTRANFKAALSVPKEFFRFGKAAWRCARLSLSARETPVSFAAATEAGVSTSSTWKLRWQPRKSWSLALAKAL